MKSRKQNLDLFWRYFMEDQSNKNSNCSRILQIFVMLDDINELNDDLLEN